MFVRVAVPRPLEDLFDYSFPASLGAPQVGDLVRVPFGRATLNACVLEVSETAPTLPAHVKIKAVQEKLSEDFRIPEEVIRLARFGSEYYQYSLGEALFVAAPPKPEKRLGTRAEKDERVIPPLAIQLSSAQKTIFDQMKALVENKQDSIMLLEGVTGSGKTEVYIEFAKTVLAKGQSVLVLVPEIALTSQLRERFQRALGEKVALWHSAIADGKRQDQWAKVRSGELKVIIGARSAIFAPFHNLGLIVVDEEHDATYKQEERFRYQARDLALYRSKGLKIPVILGSATPSLETLHRVKEGKVQHFKITERFSKAVLPQIELVSLAEEDWVGAGTIKTPLAESTVRAMQETLDRGEQVLVFLNRRGFSQFILCETCGWVKKCDQCSISMTYYQKRNELKCHLCGTKKTVPKICEECSSEQVFGMGSGTESLEEDLSLVLKDAQILRLDRDQVTSQKRLDETLDDFRNLKANVLIGTQMLVKGHDFPRVTCVVVANSDALLKWPDFRAAERALQTLIQVSGRAGRGELPGRVYLQGYDLDHPVLQILTGAGSQEAFFQNEMELRELLHYPPFSRLVRFRFEHETEARGKQFAEKVAEEVRVFLGEEDSERLMGPSEAQPFRVQNRYRFDLYFKSPSLDLLYKVSKELKRRSKQEEFDLIVDVDPYNS